MCSSARYHHGLAWVTLSAISLFVPGCGSMSADNPAGNGAGAGSDSVSPASATLFSTIETPDFGRYDLVARGPDDASGDWQFAVRSGRGAPTKNELRFVWDFGDGTTFEGVEQSYSFTTNGSYVIKVTAIKLDGTVAFILTLNVQVAIAGNEPPSADAGTDQTADANALVFLYSGASSDPDGDPLTYQWVQISGVPVLLLHGNEPTASFITPTVPQDSDLVFVVTVSDGQHTAQDTVVVHALKAVQPATTLLVTADAGADQLNVAEGQTLTLDGRGSRASDGSVLTYAWSQTSGLSVALTNAQQATASVTTPRITVGTTAELIFELVATARDQSASDSVRVVVVHDPLSGGGDPPQVVDPCTLDSDGDGVNDCDDRCPGADDRLDSNGNGIPDCLEVLTRVVAAYSEQPVVVNGVFNAAEWSDANHYFMDATNLAQAGNVVQGTSTSASDTSADVWLKHDATFLYVAVRVHDDTVIPTATSVWNADVVEVFMDVDNSRTPDMGTDRFQLDVNAGGQVATTAGVPGGSWSGAASVLSDGYVVEYRIDKASAGLTGQSTHGFDIAVSDIEPTTSNVQTRYFFFATAEASRDESLWGTLEFAPGAPTADATKPTAPTNLGAAAASPSQINLSWTAATDNVAVTGYQVNRNGTRVGTTSTTSYADAGLTASTSYTYTVAATDAAGNVSAPSTQATATTTPAPDTTKPTAPTNVVATAASSSQINLSWTAATDNVAVTGYQVNRNGTRVGTPANASYSDTGLTASTSYTYTVAATDAAGNVSVLSTQAGATTPAATGTPTLAVSPTSLDFGSTTTSLTFQVWNGGTGTLTYTIAEDPAWLSVSPNSGTSTGTTNRGTITATVNRAGLTAGSYSSAIRATGAGTTTNINVTMSVSAGGALPMSTASRTSGVAPLAVFFDAVTAASGVVQPSNGDYASPYYKWDFGDPTSGTWATNGKSKNSATGYVAAHVYENPGSYTVALRVIAPSGQAYDYQQPITVQAFTGTTYYVSSSGGADTNNGLSPAAPFQSFAKGMSKAVTNTRVLFKRGGLWTISTGASITDNGPGIIGAYAKADGSDDSTQAKPRITITSANALFGFPGSTHDDWRIVDLELSGPGSGATAGSAIDSGGNGNLKKLLLLRLNIHDFWVGFMVTFGATDHADNMMVDSVQRDNTLHAAFIGGSRTALIGNDIQRMNNHVVRVWHGDRMVIANNIIHGSSAGHALKIHNLQYPFADSVYIVVSGNDFQAGNYVWTVAIGPENGQSDERVNNVVFERNMVRSNVGQQAGLMMWAPNATTRNNLFLGDGGTPWYTGVVIAQRGIEPPPVDNVVENNTIYRGDSSSEFTAVAVDGSAQRTIVINNLASAPNSNSKILIGGSATSLSQSSNLLTIAPGFVNAAAGDFQLLATSPALNTGTSVPVFDDYAGATRPQGSGYDIGGYERAAP
jgi:chitodextrinase